MLQLAATIRKELLMLLRDRGGLAIMFLMPMAMITIMALIQDAPFRDYQEIKIPLLLVNKDTGKLGKSIEKGLTESKIFEITKSALDENLVKQKIIKEEYEIGIIIPSDATVSLNSKISRFVSGKLSAAGFPDSLSGPKDIPLSAIDLQIYFSPDTKKSFKASILGSLKQSTAKLETQLLLEAFSNELNKGGPEADEKEPLENLVSFREVNTVETAEQALQLNSVQHNVPAWTIFGMFFIVISMSGSIIKERDDGSYMRILTMPGSYITVLAGKISAYLMVCLIQCLLMLLAGLFLLPHLGLPQLVIGNNLPAIILVAISTGLAATGFGVLVGTLFKTHQQSSTFGAVSVVILAALGGIWVPVFVMPGSIRMLAEFSPLYWSLSAFHKLFLTAADISAVLPAILKLFVFFILTLSAAFFYNKNQRPS